MRKLCYYILLLMAAPMIAIAQEPDWQWVRKAPSMFDGSMIPPSGPNISVDAWGNLYEAGIFTDSIDLGNYWLMANNSSGHATGYLVKYNPNGQVLWAKDIGLCAHIYQIKVSASGYIFLAGSASLNSPFGNPPIGQPNATPDFIAKLDGSGNLLWSRVATQLNRMAGNFLGTSGMAGFDVDGGDNVIISGDLQETLVFGQDTIRASGVPMPFRGIYSPYLVRYDSSGNVVWAFVVPGIGTFTPPALDNAGNIYVGGEMDSTLTFNAGNTATSHGLFVAKYNASGQFQWVTTSKVPYNSYNYSSKVAVDANSNVIQMGVFTDSLTIGGTAVLRGQGGVFLVKYNNAGSMLWAKATPPTSRLAGDIRPDRMGNIYFSAGYTDSVVLGMTTLRGARILVSNGTVVPVGSAMFLSKMDPDGNYLWAKNLYTRNLLRQSDYMFTISLNNITDEIYLGGSYTDTLQCGSFRLVNIPSTGAQHFLAKLSNIPNSVPQTSAADELRLFPNPTSGEVHAHFSNTVYNSMQLIDQVGRQVYSRALTAGSKDTVLQLPNIPDGLYYARFTNGDGKTITKKIMIRH